MRICKCEVCGCNIKVDSGYRLLCNKCCRKSFAPDAGPRGTMHKMKLQGYRSSEIRSYANACNHKSIGWFWKYVDGYMSCRCASGVLCVKHEFQIKRIINDLRELKSTIRDADMIDEKRVSELEFLIWDMVK